MRGFFLNQEDIAFKKYILDISCNGKTFFKKEDLPMLNQYVFTELNKLEEDKLVLWNQRGVLLTELGNHLARLFDIIPKDGFMDVSTFSSFSCSPLYIFVRVFNIHRNRIVVSLNG